MSEVSTEDGQRRARPPTERRPPHRLRLGGEGAGAGAVAAQASEQYHDPTGDVSRPWDERGQPPTGVGKGAESCSLRRADGTTRVRIRRSVRAVRESA